jgi:hypothetical protein
VSANVFGSGDLTPDFVRSITFEEHDGRVDAAHVQLVLEQIASAMEVLQASDPEQALRREFARNAEIAQQVLDAGQAAGEQLRRQAAEEARAILDETRATTSHLRETVQRDIDTSQTQLEAMRGAFIQDLRDLYDRIGASLYRFERAAADGGVAPIHEPLAGIVEEVAAAEVAAVEAPETHSFGDDPFAALPPAEPTEPAAEVSPEQTAPAPAWTQLPSDAWSTPEGGAPPNDPVAAFVVEEDEPLAPGEPLVDLRQFDDIVSDEAPVAPEAHAEAPVVDEPVAAAEPGEFGLSWLEEPVAQDPSETEAQLENVVPDASVVADNALAEALIAGDGAEAEPAVAQAEPEPPHEPTTIAGAPEASADAMAVRQLILDALASGQTRDSLEAYLRDQLGLIDPAVLIDSALGVGPAGDTQQPPA